MQETTKYGVAVFDFDGTIIHGDSFISFARFAVGNLHFAIAALMSSPWLVAWKLKIIPGGKAKEHLFRNLYRGMNIVEFKKHCRDFTPWIQSHMIAGTAEKLNRHTSLGHRIYIISASPAEWIRPWAAAAGIPENNIAGTEIELTPDGNITGYFASPNCRGIEKVNRLKKIEPRRENYELWAYGDSSGDTEMLAFADHPYRI